MSVRTIGIVAGLGQLPTLGARAARERGWDAVVVSVAGGARPELAAEAVSFEECTLGEYGRILAAFTARGVRDVYVLGKLPKSAIARGTYDDAARRVLATVAERGDHAIIEAFVKDMGRHGLTVHSQLDLLQRYLLPAGFAAGRALTDRERRDVHYGLEVACLLADGADAGQTVVVKDGVVLALEAAEGTDETIRRGGRLGGPGAVVVKVKGRRSIDFELPAVGHATIDAMAEVGAAVLGLEAERMLLIDAEGVAARVRELGMALVAVERSEAS